MKQFIKAVAFLQYLFDQDRLAEKLAAAVGDCPTHARV